MPRAIERVICSSWEWFHGGESSVVRYRKAATYGCSYDQKIIICDKQSVYQTLRASQRSPAAQRDSCGSAVIPTGRAVDHQVSIIARLMHPCSHPHEDAIYEQKGEVESGSESEHKLKKPGWRVIKTRYHLITLASTPLL